METGSIVRTTKSEPNQRFDQGEGKREIYQGVRVYKHARLGFLYQFIVASSRTNITRHILIMLAKFIVLFGLIAISQAGILAPAAYYAPAQTIIKKVVAAEEPANYHFNYAVNDASTGDVHSQEERAENGAIKGSYQLNDADGFLRTVEYTADDIHGFQANVRREPLHVVKKVIAQPTITKIIQPAHAAPAGPWY